MRPQGHEPAGPPGGPDGRNDTRTVAWRRLDGTSVEVCQLVQAPGGPVMRGAVAGVLAASPFMAWYTVRCTATWETHRADVELEYDGRLRTLRLERDDETGWRVDGRADDALRHARDVDLGITPATNTLPIRRLGPRRGEAASVTAAWVRFPDLSVAPLFQAYRHLEDGRYRYESRGGSFAAELLVDPQGLVVRYGDIWDRCM